jgi:hypothetical protein
MDDIFADANHREDQLYDELSVCPVCELTGIVSPNGVTAGRSRGQEFWSLLLTFNAWRIGSEAIRTQPLTLRRRVTDKELRRFQELIGAEMLVRIQARICEVNVFGSPQGQLEEFIELDSADSELQAHLTELQKPVTHKDERFGTFKFDRRLSWYSAKVKWNSETVNLHANAEEREELDAALKVAYALWDNESTWHKSVGDYAVEKLLTLKNEGWLDDKFRNRHSRSLSAPIAAILLPKLDRGVNALPTAESRWLHIKCRSLTLDLDSDRTRRC